MDWLEKEFPQAFQVALLELDADSDEGDERHTATLRLHAIEQTIVNPITDLRRMPEWQAYWDGIVQEEKSLLPHSRVQG
jgi:hypothetical protein